MITNEKRRKRNLYTTMPDLKFTITQLSKKDNVERKETVRAQGQMQNLGVDRKNVLQCRLG